MSMHGFNFCSATWATDEPCPDYPEDGGEHLCGENVHELHRHRCSCDARWSA